MKIGLTLSAAAFAAAQPLAALPAQGDQPIGVPARLEQGVNFVYVDPRLNALADRTRQGNWSLPSIGYEWMVRVQHSLPNPIFLALHSGLERYRTTWGALPQVPIPEGPALKKGSEGERVEMLRSRLGLPPGRVFDSQLGQALGSYQRVHALDITGVADAATVNSLNRGPVHYERLIIINLERARRLPSIGEFERYVLVDSAAAEIYLFDRDRVTDSMRAIVGSKKYKTPMIAVLLESAKVRPYWNVPSDMVRRLTAPRVVKQGVSYLKRSKYEVLSGWGPESVKVDPAGVDWKEVAAGNGNIRVRQLPGPWNAMGGVKFETPNDFGIYLHDTPGKALFAKHDRWISNGCVRLEDSDRFASWVMGELPKDASSAEQVVDLPHPVPVYMTYLTAVPGGGGVQFRPDRYGFDGIAMQRLFGTPGETASAF